MKCLVEVFWSDDDDGYIAIVPDLPGCSAFGTTPEAAVHEIGDATLAWIAACRTSGDPVPEPRPRPAARPDGRACDPAQRYPDQPEPGRPSLHRQKVPATFSL